MKFVWAAYKKGALASMGAPFDELGMSADAFRETFENGITANYDAAWTLMAQTSRGLAPVGLALAFWPHQQARYLILDRMTWFPWASPRNRVEAATAFFNEARKEFPMIGTARPVDKGFFVVLMRHGIINQVGTSMNVYGDEPAAVYETRRVTS